MNKKNTHCSYCGTRFTEQILWPRKCFKCYNESYNSPVPVVIVLFPVVQECVLNDSGGAVARQYGTLIQKRNINPGKGEWALTGGHIDSCEYWKTAAVREVYEELGLQSKEDDYKLLDVTGNHDNSDLLVFCYYNLILSDKMIDDWKFAPNEEVSDIKVMYGETKLAFESHTKYANEYIKFLNNELLK